MRSIGCLHFNNAVRSPCPREVHDDVIVILIELVHHDSQICSRGEITFDEIGLSAILLSYVVQTLGYLRFVQVDKNSNGLNVNNIALAQCCWSNER